MIIAFPALRYHPTLRFDNSRIAHDVWGSRKDAERKSDIWQYPNKFAPGGIIDSLGRHIPIIGLVDWYPPPLWARVFGALLPIYWLGVGNFRLDVGVAEALEVAEVIERVVRINRRSGGPGWKHCEEKLRQSQTAYQVISTMYVHSHQRPAPPLVEADLHL
jgi:hypothetical protein